MALVSSQLALHFQVSSLPGLYCRSTSRRSGCLAALQSLSASWSSARNRLPPSAVAGSRATCCSLRPEGSGRRSGRCCGYGGCPAHGREWRAGQSLFLCLGRVFFFFLLLLVLGRTDCLDLFCMLFC